MDVEGTSKSYDYNSFCEVRNSETSKIEYVGDLSKGLGTTDQSLVIPKATAKMVTRQLTEPKPENSFAKQIYQSFFLDEILSSQQHQIVNSTSSSTPCFRIKLPVSQQRKISPPKSPLAAQQIP